MSVKVGQKAPSVRLETVDGNQVQLADYWQNGRLLYIIFLRHLG